jgi:hypothetical protein
MGSDDQAFLKVNGLLYIQILSGHRINHANGMVGASRC